MLSGKIYTGTKTDLFSHPLLDGVKISLPWSELEPQARSYSFEKLKSLLEAIPQGKQVVFELLVGVDAPAWVKPNISLAEANGRRVLVPRPWSKNYISALSALYANLGKELGQDAFSAINASFIGSAGPKLRWVPHNYSKDPDNEFDLVLFGTGFSLAGMKEAWQEVAKVASYQWPLADLWIPLELEGAFPDNRTNLDRTILVEALAAYPGRILLSWDKDEEPPPAVAWYEAQGARLVWSGQTNGPRVQFVEAPGL